jgi:uncharacterized membrane protein
MSSPRLPRIIFGVIAIIAAAECVLDYRQLPNRMASHFGASGAANGWMTKPAFFAIYAVMIGLSALVGFLAPRSIEKKSPARINLPNKEYWLAPEHRAETFAFFRRSFAWYSCALLLILVLVMGLAIQANFTSPPRMPTGPILSVIIGFVLFNLVWVIGLVRHFSNPS